MRRLFAFILTAVFLSIPALCKAEEADPVRIFLLFHGDPVTTEGAQTEDILEAVRKEISAEPDADGRPITLWLENASVLAVLGATNPEIILGGLATALDIPRDRAIDLLLRPEAYPPAFNHALDRDLKNLFDGIELQIFGEPGHEKKLPLSGFNDRVCKDLEKRLPKSKISVRFERPGYESAVVMLKAVLAENIAVNALLAGQPDAALFAKTQSQIYTYKNILTRDEKLAEDIRQARGASEQGIHLVLRGALHTHLAKALEAWQMPSRVVHVAEGKWSHLLQYDPSIDKDRATYLFVEADYVRFLREWMMGFSLAYLKKQHPDRAPTVELYGAISEAVTALSDADVRRWAADFPPRKIVSVDPVYVAFQHKRTWEWLAHKFPALKKYDL